MRVRARELAERERRAPQLAIAEPANGAREPQGDPTLIELSDHRELVREVARSHIPSQNDRVSDAQLRDGRGRADRVQQLTTRLNGVGDRDQMLIKLP
ncbi:MAG: hypothetical protein ACTHQQ_23435 [Solirubrobacteraceae bacterium]